MKPLFLFLISIILISCSQTEQTSEVETEEVESSVEFVKYPSVLEMLRASYDFNEEQGALKVLSKDGESLHIQVSKLVIEGDDEKAIKEQTMRDIVYVAFESFAQTDVSELTITSVPMKAKKEYVDQYKMTATINRETAKKILQKYLNTQDFQELFILDGTLWLPSEKFDNLKFKNLSSVFDDMKS